MEITFGRIFGEIWIWVDFVEWGKLCKFAGEMEIACRIMKNYACTDDHEELRVERV